MTETSVDEDELLELGRLTQEEDVSDVKLSEDLSEEQRADARKMLERHKELFTDLPGRARVIRHRLTLTDDKPIRSKPYPLPYAKRANLKEEIDKMLKAGIIQETNSPYASPIVIVNKKDGTDRICVDYRKLNRVTVADPEPMRTAEDLFQRVGKCRFFSKIDLSKGYWQIPAEEEDVPKTAFVTPDGHYEFLRMPFGMKNSGATLVRAMRKVLEGLAGMESYIDDIIVYNEDWDLHVRTLERLFRRLRDAGFTARPSKCVLGAGSLEFLGHTLGFDWVTPSEGN